VIQCAKALIAYKTGNSLYELPQPEYAGNNWLLVITEFVIPLYIPKSHPQAA
jgi:hypothetical protein